MTTYKALKTLITANRYTYDDMYAKLDMFLALDRTTVEQYIELTGMLLNPETVEKEISEMGVAAEGEIEPETVENPDAPGI